MGKVRIVSTKWNGSPHRESSAYWLGDDVHGSWLWTACGPRVATASGCFQATPSLRLFPKDEWWSAYFVPSHPATDRPEQWYVDVTTPATLTGDLITFIDLDLDVERVGAGGVELLDEDEFDQHRATMNYPEQVVERAIATACQVKDWMTAGIEPFGVASGEWLERALGADWL